jgi:colanic acid biosynthesis glycosyl transferase WcaI
MRLLILSQYYDPEPVPKAGEMARAMKQRGHDVSVITGVPNYPSGVLYEGSRQVIRSRETIDGVPVVRTYEYPYHGKSVVGRLLNYWSFVASSVLATGTARGKHVMYVWHPPLTVGVAAWLLGSIARVPFVYDVQDIWPESAVLSGMMRDGLVARLMHRLEKFVYKRAAHILVVTDGAKQNLVGKGVPAEKISVMPHWIDEKLFPEVQDATREATRREFGWGDDFVVLFAGNLGMVQGLDTVVRAARELRGTKVRIALMGEGADRERLVKLAEEIGAGDRLQFVPRQNVERMAPIMGSADALLVHLRRAELSRYVIPTKTLSYLAAGRPIVMAMEGAAADLVADAEAGVIIEPDDAQLLARTLIGLSAMPSEERAGYGRRGREYLLKNLAKEHVLDLYEQVLLRAAKPS